MARIGPVYTPREHRGRGYAAPRSRRCRNGSSTRGRGPACSPTRPTRPPTGSTRRSATSRWWTWPTSWSARRGGDRRLDGRCPRPPRPPVSPTYAEAEDALLARWPETKLEPSLDRIEAFVELLGEPQRAYPVIHLTGTNGKTSTSRMIDTLMRRHGPAHRPVHQPARRVDDRADLARRGAAERGAVRRSLHRRGAVSRPRRRGQRRTRCRSSRRSSAWPTPPSRTRPVDVAVVEVGMGGSWDATNVADATVAVITPIAVDHARYLGSRPVDIAVEKAGIIKAGATVVCAEQADDVADGDRRAGRGGRRHRCPGGPRLRGGAPRRRGGRADVAAARPARRVRRGLPPAVRRPPGAERGARAGRGGGVHR